MNKVTEEQKVHKYKLMVEQANKKKFGERISEFLKTDFTAEDLLKENIDITELDTTLFSDKQMKEYFKASEVINGPIKTWPIYT